MATMLAPPMLSISGSSTVGRSDLTVTYIVFFDALDINTDQTYHAHATVVGDDTTLPGQDGHDDVIYEWGIGDFHASMAPVKGVPLIRNTTFSVPNTGLNEDDKARTDQIRVLVTLTPQVGQVVGPIRSNMVTLSL